MKQVVTNDDIRSLGTILGVWAHPDDESFTCAGIMAAAIENGQTVICITATRGEAGVQDESRWPPSQLGEIRAAELADALRILGVKHHHWLGYPDGGCADVNPKDAVEKIKQLIDRYSPDTILTFGPDGMTGHPDHQTVSKWASLAAEGEDISVYHVVENKNTYEKYLKKADEQFNIYFNIDQPPLREKRECDIGFCLNHELVRKKFTALAAMPSQTEGMLKTFPEEVLDEIYECECFVKAEN